jgi:putative ABC transport system permease protein
VLRAEDGRAGQDGAGSWMRSALVVVQVACALVLATCSALTLRSIINRQTVDLGFEPRGAVRGEVSLTGERYQSDSARRTAANAILDALAEAPDVQAAGIVTWALPTAAGAQRVLSVPARNDAALNPAVRRGIEAVTPDYFEAVGTALVSGRFFTSADRAGGEAVALINEELARHLWPAGNAIGELLRLGTVEEGAPVVRVVGVVGTIRRSPMHDIPVARVYVPYEQYPGPVLTIAVRTRGNLAAAERTVEAAVRRIDPDLIVDGLRTLEADMAQFVAPLRLVTWVLTGFAGAGVLLAALGVFGTMSYNVTRRQRELAIRSALGATGRDIFSLVFAGALRLTAAGLVIGIAATLAVTRALASFLFGVSPTDPVTIASAALVLALAALGACYLPARLAATADPLPILKRD